MAVAYPFVEVSLDDKGLVPVAQRAPGVLAIVGTASGGNVAAGVPKEVDDVDGALAAFGDGSLVDSLLVALKQNPRPSKIYGLHVAADDEAGWKGAFEVLSGVQDVTFVVAAGRVIKTLSAGAVDAVALLKKHCEDNAINGQPRIGVAAVDPAIARSGTYVTEVTALVEPYKTDRGRMIVIAARGAKYDDGDTADVAAAAAAAIAGRAPETSMVLKVVSGFNIGAEEKYTPVEIKELSELLVIPIIDPLLVPGDALHFAEGTCLAKNLAFKYIDVVRLLDDIDFALKANLVGLVGDARITRTGLNAVRRRLEGVLDGYVGRQAITSYRILIDLLPIVDKPEASWSPAEQKVVRTAREQRVVAAVVVVVIGPAVHRIVIHLQPTFVAA